MAGEKITAFIPCRAGSERVRHKNTRPFAGFENGLLELKLRQLAGVGALDEILVSSNDAQVLEIAEGMRRSLDGRIAPLERPDEWGHGSTSMGAFITDYIADLREDGILFWTHVTHPFVRASDYEAAIRAFRLAQDEGADSLVSVTRIQKFLWKDGKPLNYDNIVEKWPRSQDIDPVFEINHAIYMIPFAVMQENGDRIGKRPGFHEMEEAVAMDIDWEDQFLLLDEIAQARVSRGLSLL